MLGVIFLMNSIGVDPDIVRPYMGQLMVVLPSMAMFFCLLYGILFEFNQSVFNISVDAINWLPVSASDYVLGSTLCTIYYSLPILSLLMGATLGLAILTGGIQVWLLTVALSVAGAFIGAFTMELVRVVFNRASSSISRRSGRTAVVGRLILSIGVVVIFSSIYNFNVIMQITAWFSSVAGAAWFFPLIWPSLSILAFSNSDFLGTATYLILSLVLVAAFFYAGTRARAANWSPEPVTISFSDGGKRKAPDSRLIGLTQAESAIVRKDLRGLLRRREMIGFLALPFIMVIVNLLNGSYSEAFSPGASTASKLILFALPCFGLILLNFYLAAVGIGSEGGAMLNILSSPLTPRQIAKAKIVAATVPSMIGLPIILVAATIFSTSDPSLLVLLMVLSVVATLESTVVGLAIGARFPDYTEVPRARFISPTGALIGMGALMAVVGGTVAACMLVMIRSPSGYGLAAAISIAVITGAVITILVHRIAVSWVRAACDSAPL